VASSRYGSADLVKGGLNAIGIDPHDKAK